jgi:hypothetical protein
MKRKHRILYALLPAFAAAGVLVLTAGCGSKPSTPSAGPAPTTGPTQQSGGSDLLSNILNSKNNTACINNLKQIGIACHVHADATLELPTNIKDANSKKLLSWRVQILPSIEEGGLYQQFKLDEPWDSPHNKKLLEHMPVIYLDPRFQEKADKPTVTYYRGFAGDGGVLGADKGVALGAITNANGTPNTFMVVEAGEPAPWTKPDDLVIDPKKPLPPLGGPQRTDFYALFCDGHVQKIPASTSEKTLRCMMNWMNAEPFLVPK